MKTVAIIGAGKVGGAIGRLLADAGYTVTAVGGRDRERAAQAKAFIGSGEVLTDAAQAALLAEIIFITTPDAAIRPVCEAIASGKGFRKGSIVIHASGAQTRDLLQAAAAAGACRAVLHPLQSVLSRELGVRNIPGSYFRIEADPEAERTARELVAALGGIELKMPNWRPGKTSAAVYHAGAVAASNFFVSVVDMSLRCYEALGADRKEALKAVLPLIKGTLANIESEGVPQALTGPILRGDVGTVQDHLDALAESMPELLPLYRELARHTVQVARDKGGIPPDAADEILRITK